MPVARKIRSVKSPLSQSPLNVAHHAAEMSVSKALDLGDVT